MQVDISDVEDNKCVVSITLPKSEVDSETNFIANQIQPTVAIKGFRKGNVPLPLVKSNYRDHLLDKVSEKLVVRSTSDALKKQDLKNVSNPELLEEYRAVKGKRYVGKFNLDGSFSFAVSVELPPEIELKDYRGIEVEISSKNFDDWFKKQIHEQQVMYGEKSPVDRVAVSGDELFVDFSGSIGGEPLDGGTEENYRLIVGDGDLPEDFENSFIGRKPGEEFDVAVKFPEDYPQDALAGNECDFKCTLKELYELVPHDLDDELAQMLSYGDVDEMMKGYQEKFESEYSAPMRAQLFNSIMDQLLEANPFDAPEGWIMAEMRNTVQRLGAENFESNPQLLESIKDISERTVKIAFILDKIYEAETDVHLTAEEFQAKANEEAEKINMSGTDLIERLKAQGTYEGFVTFHEQQKVIDLLIDNAKVKEKEVNE